MRVFRFSVIALVLAAMLIGLWQAGGVAALFSAETSVLDRIVYLLIVVAALVVIGGIFFSHLLTPFLGRLGDASGKKRGPRAGEGAVIHNSSGEADFDGSSRSVPPSSKEGHRDSANPPTKSAD